MTGRAFRVTPLGQSMSDDVRDGKEIARLMLSPEEYIEYVRINDLPMTKMSKELWGRLMDLLVKMKILEVM